jgi:hypothetical protein
MIDIYIYSDMRRRVKKKCKKLYKKSFWDRSWKKEVNPIMSKGYSSIIEFLKD